MSENESKPDFYSGLPWVYVPPEKARAHPKGQLNLFMWLIVAYFIGMSLLKMGLALSFGLGAAVAILNGIWPLLTGIGLAIRVPWSIVMACISAALTVYALVRGVEAQPTLLILFEIVANVGILFYLLDGDRPNFIYRHRYRKYSVETGQGDDQ